MLLITKSSMTEQIQCGGQKFCQGEIECGKNLYALCEDRRIICRHLTKGVFFFYK